MSPLLERMNTKAYLTDWFLLIYVGTGTLAGAVASPVREMGALLGASLGIGLSVIVHMITKPRE